LTDEEKILFPKKKCIITDMEFFKSITKLNAKRGVFNIHKGEKIASCCRLTSDLAELKSQIKMDSFGNGGMSIGSHRVVTMNLHGLAMIAIKENRDLDLVINEYQNYCEKLLVVHKELLADIVKSGVLKFFNIGWVNLNMFFSTFGFIGLYDSYKVLKQFNKETRTYEEYSKDVLSQLEDNAKDAGRRNKGYAFNVEEIPGENAAVKLAQKDNYLYYKFPNYQRVELLSNQMIPLFEHDFNMDERLTIMGDLMNINSGGAICHLNIDGSMTDEVSEELTRAMIEDYDITHFAMNVGTSTCVKGHTNIGIFQQCPECASPIETWTTRVVGFNTDTTDWASVRREWELPRRKWYNQHETGI
jgi:ribonucleoside-triphosphate reductase